MRISELSRLTGASVRSLRHYEAKGLIETTRLENGYRDYDKSIIEQIQAIQLYLRLDLNIDEIRSIFTCKGLGQQRDLDVEQEDCRGNVLDLYTKKVQAIDIEMQTLARTRSHLVRRVSLIQRGKERRF